MQAKQFGKILFKIFITLIFTVMGGWLVYFNWIQRPIHYRNYTFSPAEAQRLQPFARAQYAHGLNAWFRNDTQTAAAFYRKAVSRDVFFLDAWLRLAEAEAALGHDQKARNILAFAVGLTEDVLRWKWAQILLARDLGMDEILYRNCNYLLSHRQMLPDVLQLLRIHLGADVTATLGVLNPENLIAYLNWLMRWGMSADSLAVWQKICQNGKPDTELAMQYAHFLLNQMQVTEAMAVWQEYHSLDGVTNPGFEKEITQRGFDWRYGEDKSGDWRIERVNQGAFEGQHALRISFSGQRNITFQNLFQIVPVVPSKRFRLHYSWKSENISTDQGPFVEIAGYDQDGFYQSGPMITGTHEWRRESIEFRPPAGCRAVVVRVRRHPSRRFDSKIKGVLWLDNFRLEDLDSEKKPILSEKIL